MPPGVNRQTSTGVLYCTERAMANGFDPNAPAEFAQVSSTARPGLDSGPCAASFTLLTPVARTGCAGDRSAPRRTASHHKHRRHRVGRRLALRVRSRQRRDRSTQGGGRVLQFGISAGDEEPVYLGEHFDRARGSCGSHSRRVGHWEGLRRFPDPRYVHPLLLSSDQQSTLRTLRSSMLSRTSSPSRPPLSRRTGTR